MFFKTIKQTFKLFSQKLCKDERGEIVTTLIIAGVLITALVGGGAYVYNNWQEITKTAVGAALYLMVSLSAAAASFAGSFFSETAGSTLLQKSITGDASVVAGWAIVRDFANMFVVLGFVVIGIATILRIREYEAQKTLLPLIIVAILINFSLLFCGVIIDASNITVSYFTQASGASSVTNPMISIITKPEVVNFVQKKANSSEGYSNLEFIISAASYSMIAFTTAMIFFIYGVVYLFRYVALMLLVILSPLGFVCYVFPTTKQIFKKWWEQFFQWSIIGIPASFFVYLAGHMVQDWGLTSSNPSSGPSLAYWVPAGFLLFGYSLIFQTSAIGASAAIGLTTGALGYAAGAGKGAVKWGGKQAWNSRAGQAARQGAMRAGEKMGLVAPGTANLARQKQLEEHESEKRAATWNAAQRKALATERTVMTRRGRNDKVEAIKQMAAKGELGSLSSDQLQAAMSYAKAYGVPNGVLSKGDYRAAEFDEARIKKLTDAGKSPAYAKEIVRREQLAQNLPNMTEEQRRNINPLDILPSVNLSLSTAENAAITASRYDLVKENFTPHMISQLQTAPQELKDAMRTHMGQLSIDIAGATNQNEKTALQKKWDAIDKYCR